MSSTNVINVKNVSDKDFEFTFDGRPYLIPAGQTVALLEDAARHGVYKSIRRFHVGDQTYESLLIIVGEGEEPAEPIKAPGPEEELLKRDPDDKVEAVKFSNPDAPKGAKLGGKK